jgi:hypothetical protein
MKKRGGLSRGPENRAPPAHLGGKLPLDVLHLPPQHEGLQDLVQPVDDHHALLRLEDVRASAQSPRPLLRQRLPKPLRERGLVIKDLQCTTFDALAMTVLSTTP